MNNIKFKYSLQKGSRKTTCPQCGKARCFKPYVNNETGEPLHPDVGRCDHEQSCQYHYSPNEFFRDHPEARQETAREKLFTKPIAKQSAPITDNMKQTIFFPLSWAEGGVARDSVFSKWLGALGYDKERVRCVREDYYLGATAKDTFVEGVNYGPAAVFWMIDEKHQVHDAKLIAFHTNGHRVQGWGNSMRSICKNSKKGPQLENTDKCFFGLHLISRYPDKPVCIVESEKTALICACRYPNFVWLASGGCNGLTIEKLQPLMDRKLIIYPDSGEYDKWKEDMKNSGHKDYRMIDVCEAYEPNTDLADLLLGEGKLKAPVPMDKPVEETVTPKRDDSLAETAAARHWQRLKEDNPALQLLEDKFDLILEPPSTPCPF